MSNDKVEVYVPPTQFVKSVDGLVVKPSIYLTGCSILLVTPEVFWRLYEAKIIDKEGNLIR